MSIMPLQLPVWKDVPQLNFAPLDQVGNALMMRGIVNGMNNAPDPMQQGQPQGNSLATLGQPQASNANAISGIESSGNYAELGPVIDKGAYAGDRAYGKYQVMGKNVPEWTQEVLGRSMSPQEFVANPQAQDAVFNAKFGQLAQKYGPEGAARAWFAGEGGMNDMGRRDQLGTSVADYSRKFTDATGGAAPTALAFNGPNPPLPSAITQGQPQSGSVSSQPGGASMQPSQVPTQVAQAQPSGPASIAQSWMTPAKAQQYESAAQSMYSRATAAAMLNPAMSAAMRARADAYMKQAEIIRQSLGKNSETTPEQKNAVDPNVIGFETRKAGISAAAKNTELTPEQKNAASSGGMTPLEFDTTKESYKQDSDTFQKRYTGIQAAAQQSYKGQEQAQLMKQLTLQPGFYSGPLHEGVQTFNQFRSIFGSNPSSALPTEAFNKVANDALQEKVKAMGQSGVGRVLQSEVNIMKQSIASLGITPQSNRALAEILGRTYKTDQDIGEITRTLKAAPGQRNVALDTAVNDYLKSHPMFTPQERQHPELLGAPDAPAQATQWSPQQVSQWASSVGLKSGDPMRFNGQIVKVP